MKNVPLNPKGRTGLKGRGVLGRYGPNHAADPIVTRWKTHPEGGIIHDKVSSRPILQFVAIQRRDTSEWAIPGGMVDPGENVSETLRREFMEEALDSGTLGTVDKEVIEAQMKAFFMNGRVLYKARSIKRGVSDRSPLKFGFSEKATKMCVTFLMVLTFT